MKNLFFRFLYLFYRYYDKGSTREIAYEAALLALIFVLFLNIFSILLYFSIPDIYFPNSSAVPKFKKYIVGFLILIPVLFLFKNAFKKHEIINVKMNKNEIRIGYFIVVSYILCSVILLIWVINNR